MKYCDIHRAHIFMRFYSFFNVYDRPISDRELFKSKAIIFNMFSIDNQTIGLRKQQFVLCKISECMLESIKSGKVKAAAIAIM